VLGLSVPRVGKGGQYFYPVCDKFRGFGCQR
jgi:hypothetical protein